MQIRVNADGQAVRLGDNGRWVPIETPEDAEQLEIEGDTFDQPVEPDGLFFVERPGEE